MPDDLRAIAPPITALPRHEAEVTTIRMLLLDLHIQLCGGRPVEPLTDARVGVALGALRRIEACQTDYGIRY